MKRALCTLALIVALPAQAQVDPKIHKLCTEAKDYVGCVKAMRGETSPDSSRTINSQGADIAEGNQCPAGYAYIGGGNCDYVGCEYNSSGFNALGHDSMLAGLKDANGKDVWACKWSFWHGAGVLRLRGTVRRASNNPSCPSGEPAIGYNSTCQTSKDKSLFSGSDLGTLRQEKDAN